MRVSAFLAFVEFLPAKPAFVLGKHNLMTTIFEQKEQFVGDV